MAWQSQNDVEVLLIDYYIQDYLFLETNKLKVAEEIGSIRRNVYQAPNKRRKFDFFIECGS